MCGGGGDTTNVTEETGLGDDQFENLTAGQETIRSDISGLGNAAEDRYNTTTDTLSTMASDNTQGFADVNSGIAGLGTDVGDFRTYAEKQFGYLEDENDVLIDQNIGVQNSVNEGFVNTDNNIEAGFNAVDSRFVDTDTNINNRFDATDESIGTGFNNLTDTVTDNFDETNTAIDTGFTDTNANIDEVGTTLGSQLTETSSNVLTGQDAISKLIEKYGGNAATYYQDLAKNQGTILEKQGTMQTAFDGYLTDFGDYTTLANQTRTDLGNTVVGGFETMGQVLGNQATANADGFSSVGDAVTGVGNSVADVTSDVASAAGDAETNFGDIASSISGVGTDVAGVGSAVGDAASSSATNFSSIATDIASGFTDQSAEGVQRKNDFVSTLTSVQDILQADTGALDATVKANYQSVVSSFDDQGNLITDTVTAEGTTITRALSDQGDLFIAEFDANGQRIAQQTLDLNSLLNNVSTFETNMQDQFTGIFGDAEVAADSRQSILDAFSITDGLIGDVGTGVSAELTSNFDLISTAFDEQGNFLADSIDENGNTITRSLDENGNLITKSFDSTNTLLDETSINIGDVSSQLNNMQIGLGDQLTSAFASLSDANAQSEVNISETLSTISGSIGEVGTSISDELSGNLTSLSKAFDENGNLITRGFDNFGENITREFDAQGNILETRLDANGRSIGRSILDIAKMSEQLNTVSTGLGDQLTTSFRTMADGTVTATEGLQTTLSSITTQVGDMGTGLEGSLADSFTSLQSSFDEQGNLISEEIGANGETITREIDEQGNLITTAIGANGEVLRQSAVDIMDVSNQLNGVEAGLGDQLASAFTAMTSGNADANANIVSILGTVGTQIGDVGTGLSSELSSNLDSLNSAFDAQGNLIREDIGANGETITRALDEQGNLVTTAIGANGEILSQSSMDILDVSSQLNGVQQGLGDQLALAFDALSNGNADASAGILTTLGNITSQVDTLGSGLQSSLATDFASLKSSFDEQGNLIRSEIYENGNELRRDLDSQGNLITTELSSTGEVINQTSLNIADISTQLNGMQAGLGDTITTAFDGIQNSSEELRSNLVGNLAGLRNIMTTQGDTISADLQEKFMSLSSSFDENGDLIRSSVDANGDFIFRELNANGELVVSTIDDATGQLMESNKFNADLLTTDFDSRFNSTEEFLKAIDSSISQVGGDIDAGLLGMASGLEEGFTSRFDELSDEERAGRADFNNRLTQVRALLEEDVADLDEGLRGRMGELSNAFDGEGKLIANAIDANGNMLKRTIDDSGNLVLSTYSRMNGQILDQQALDINRLMKEISNRRVTQGSNANMGGQSPTAGAPAPASVYSGLASPYAQTY